MNESNWLTSTDPEAMLKELTQSTSPTGDRKWGKFPSDRKLRLFACACCRQVWHLLTDERSRKAVEVAERYANWMASQEEQLEADYEAAGPSGDSLTSPAWLAHLTCGLSSAAQAAHDASVVHAQLFPDQSEAKSYQAVLLRDLCGNPWRPVLVRHPKPYNQEPAIPVDAGKGWTGYDYDTPKIWLTPTVLSIAKRAYDERPGRKCTACFDGVVACQPKGPAGQIIRGRKCTNCHGTGHIEDGTLDTQTLAVLSDALEEAGCDNTDILNHLRGLERCFSCEIDVRKGGRKAGTVRIVATDFQIGSGPPKDVYLPGCKRCDGTGWRPLHGPHVRGCWVVDLLLGKE